jgi:hypothetical protein
MLCISLFDLRGQRIAKIAFSNGAGVSVQKDVGTVHFIFGDWVAGNALSEDKSQLVAGFLTPVFNSSSTPLKSSQPSRVIVFPNPFLTNIYLRNAADWGKVSISMLDLNGRVLFQDKTEGRNYAINAGFLHPGIYCLRLKFQDGHFEVYKLIKQ